MRRRSSIEEAAREVGAGVFRSSHSEVSGLVFVERRSLAACSFVFYNNVTLMVTTFKLINAVLCA